ncbi:phytanoyl-CoA dioxygenase family protein [Xenorhabdus bovienii]|uniref:phytanoyl-CoA dioxygenase family protein n=1 Tax=Xenorhabdus bovienii TaxID=40576 RepID=UPI0023B21143|nr:phytanoyl-CoA dioxygenase family protein [Xenorhabdus bovienii]MDE9437862.1 phytanoyl-CoA dioxygenase family protein [Xenorhabdus bovienii]MDE9466907.1 phytanoyl-CoA dioxygenase family protein [Xenorhabdus bovienii]MDE9499654.1 phytanoyl-CoA dioxygenase family protein [Xenorhabdus bovienii]
MANFPDFQLFSGFFNAGQKEQLDAIYQELDAKARVIVQQTQAENCTLADFYRSKQTLIVVPEKQSPERICRMEYLNGCSEAFYQQVTLLVQQRLEELVGAELTLFKDKCNVKAPQGGAFPPHQDAPAYRDFGPTIFITAGIMLDTLSTDNGCLHMATNYRDVNVGIVQNCATPYGDYPLFEYVKGGDRNGDIVDEVQKKLLWETINGQAGDMLVFNSFIPHFSHINVSQQHRRVFYLTFNLLSEGSHYQHYYRKKWQDYSNPQFHISTPTTHAALPSY